MAEQRYQAVLAVISDGLSISQVASKVGVSRQTLHSWVVRSTFYSGSASRRLQNVDFDAEPTPTQALVSRCGSATGFDSADPR